MEMLVECILKRRGGTKVDLDGTTYHFNPGNDPSKAGRDIAVVSNRAHFQRFMQIPEGYQIPEDITDAGPATSVAALTAAAPAVQAAVLPAATKPQGDGQAGQQDQIVLATLPQGTVVTQAVVDAALNGSAPEPVPIATTAETIAAGLTDPLPPALPDEAALRAMDLDALRDQATLELGRKPSTKAKEDVLISQILAIREEKAAAALTTVTP